MQVQKLVFLAQGFSLALLDRPIYYHNTHAWQWGPVVPKLYKSLQQYGSGYVAEDIPAPDEVEADSQDHEIIQAVWNVYKDYSGSQLSTLTHLPESPWDLTWSESKFGVISPERIQAYYRKLVETTA